MDENLEYNLAKDISFLKNLQSLKLSIGFLIFLIIN